MGERLRTNEARRHADAGEGRLQPFFHQMLEMEVREKDFARAAPETRQRFLTMWIDLLPAAKGDSESAPPVRQPACWC